LDDLKLLDGFVKEGKKNLNNKKPKEIELKEEKANDVDEQENQNNINNNNQDEFLNKSNIFEKGLRNRITSIDTHTQKKNFGRVSLTDNYNSKQSLQFNKNKDENKENKAENEVQNETNKKFSNIGINEELSNNNINNNININNTNTTNKEEIKEEIEETPSIYQDKIIDNTQTQLSETHINNLKITGTTNYGIKSFNLHTVKKGYCISKENDIYFRPNETNKKVIMSINKINNIEVINKIEPKDKLIKLIDGNYISKIKDENDLKEIEKSVEQLLSDIRSKIGKEEKDVFMEKMVDKYSQLIVDKISKNNNKSNLNQDKYDDDDLL